MEVARRLCLRLGRAKNIVFFRGIYLYPLTIIRGYRDGVDPLTVAQQTGTSIAMIEKAYMRFIPAALQQKLEAVKEA